MDKGLKFYDIGDTQGSQYEYSDYTQDTQLGDKDENDFTLDSLTQVTDKELNDNLIMKLSDSGFIFNDKTTTTTTSGSNISENDINTSLKKMNNQEKIPGISNTTTNTTSKNTNSSKMTASSIKSLNNICHNLVTNNNQKVIHIRNNKLILENKELREKVRILNEKLALHSKNRSVENIKKKLPLLKNDNMKCDYSKPKKYSEFFKLPTIHNKTTSVVEAKDKCSMNGVKLKSSIPKSKMPIINRKNTNIIGGCNNSIYDSPLNKISNSELKNTIMHSTNNNCGELQLSSSLSKNSSYYQKFYDSKNIIKMDSDISRKNYKIKLKQDIENLDQEINNWS